MFPDRIPQAIRDDMSRDAESAMYEALRDQLDDTWQAFAWVSWVLKKPSPAPRAADGAREGEADFVLAHPEHGLLVLEVKGGVIHYDATTHVWTSASMAGTVRPIGDPLAQACRHRHALGQKLAEVPGLQADEIEFGYAVAFPDCALPDGVLRLDSPREVLLPYGDLSRLQARIEEIARYWRRGDGKRPLGPDGVKRITAVLAKSFTMRLPLGRAIAEDSRRIIELTERQFHVLDGLARNRQVVVTGGAGTGKTLLALEKATRLARDQGFRTLLTCFNRPLAEFLRASVGAIDGLTVLNFHELCAEFARRAGRDVPDLASPSLPNKFFREDLPGLLADAIADAGERFEAMVIDEGQDFSATDRAALELLLADPDDSVLYVFQDETQAIYREASPWPEAGKATYELTENRRNTRAIHGVLQRLASDTRTQPLGPEGRPPEFVTARTAAQAARELSRVLHRLIRDEAVAPRSIAVLVSSRRAVPELVEDGRIGAFEITDAHADERDRVLVESVTRFKGLEREVIVLVRLAPVDYCEYEPMLYVGASRARSQLVVIGDDALLARFGWTPRPMLERVD